MRRPILVVAFMVTFLVGLILGTQVRSRKGGAPADQVPTAPKVASQEDTSSTRSVERASPAGKSPASPTPPEQERAPAEPSKRSGAPPADTGGFSLVPRKHHYGKVLEGEARTHTFKVDRPKGTALKLGRLYSPCPCIFVTAERRDIPGDNEAEVSVLVHSLTLEGKKSFPAYVEVLEPEKKVLRADVSIEVKRVPAKVLVKPGALHLGSVRGPKTTEVRLYNLTKRPLALGKTSCSLEGVEVSVLGGPRLKAGRYATIRLEVPEAGLPPGPVQGTVTVETNCNEHALVAIPVDGTSLRPK